MLSRKPGAIKILPEQGCGVLGQNSTGRNWREEENTRECKGKANSGLRHCCRKSGQVKCWKSPSALCDQSSCCHQEETEWGSSNSFMRAMEVFLVCMSVYWEDEPKFTVLHSVVRFLQIFQSS